MPHRRKSACLALLAGLAASLAGPAGASPDIPVGQISDQAQTTAPKTEKSTLLVVPIPLSNPSLGSGLTLAAVEFYNPNHSPQPWITGAGVTRTSNKSWAAGAFHLMSLDQDKFHALVVAGYADINVKFYGIGPNAGDRDRYVKIEDRGKAGILEGQMRVVKHLYVGARYQILDLDSAIAVPDPIFPDLNLPKPELKSMLSAIGPSITYDSRDSSLNPRHGEYVTLVGLKNLHALGSDFTHRKVQLAANMYRTLGPSTSMGARLMVCGVSKNGPFYDLCNYGQMGDLRGYESGRYRDRAMWAAQAELRQHLFGRFGAVAFAGGGGTAPNLGDFQDTKWLPSAGAGLRVLASKSNNINLRLDYAVGKHSHALYFGIGEAF